MANAYALTSRDIVGLLILLTVFVLGPMLFMLCCSRRASTSKPNLRECPHCGAEYHDMPTRCYACGHQFILPVSHAPTATIIQRVRQTDTTKTTQTTDAHSPTANKAA